MDTMLLGSTRIHVGGEIVGINRRDDLVGDAPADRSRVHDLTGLDLY